MALSRTPRVAVLLPVYNGEDFLAEAIRSVLSQTFADFELIVIDDGSTDRSSEIIDAFTDSRIRVIRFRENRGLVSALNRGIEEARSGLIARMDQDDVCIPSRFARQVAFLDAHPEVAICGTWVRQFGSGAGSVSRPPVGAEQIRVQLFFGWAMDHPSIMMRRDFLERHGLAYDERWRYVEDYDFFIRAADLAPLANLPEVLLLARDHDANITRVHRQEQVVSEERLVARQLRALIPGATRGEEEFHARVASIAIGPEELVRSGQWLLRLHSANRACGHYDSAVFWRELKRICYDLHAATIAAGPRVLFSYWNSPLAGFPANRMVGIAALALRLLRARLSAWRKAAGHE